jgi:glutaconate CoA-transferase subunit A
VGRPDRRDETKLVGLTDAAALVGDGDHITIGGVMLHRVPAAFVRELARQGRRGLRLSKPSPSYDLDLLSAAGCLAEVDAGVASFESAFGGALPNYRRAVEQGLLRVREFS